MFLFAAQYIQGNGNYQNNTFQNVLYEGVYTTLGESIEQRNQENTSKHGSNYPSSAACCGNTANDGTNHGIKLIVLAIGDSYGIQTRHEHQTAKCRQEACYHEGANISLH